MTKTQIRRTVLTAVFTALMAAGSYAAIPAGPVPIVLTTLFILLSGLLGGVRIGLYSTVSYLLLGALGLPVFAGGAAGFALFAGPTGGYMIGYMLAAAATGLLFRPKEETGRTAMVVLAGLAALAGTVLVYIPGLPWLKQSLGVEWNRALQFGLIPFIPGDLLKTIAAAGLAVALKGRFNDFLQAD